MSIILRYLLFLLLCTIIDYFFFFFNDTATTEIYTLSLHDALPIYVLFESAADCYGERLLAVLLSGANEDGAQGDRKSTRLNSSHLVISYAVFCLKKKKYTYEPIHGRQNLVMPTLVNTLSIARPTTC